MFKIKQDRPKVNDLQWFQTNRSELYNYVINKVQKTNKKIKLVPAPVKCGKRGMVEVARLSNPEFVHIFLTALHRIADKEQHKELYSYGLNVFSINNKKKKDDCIEFINKTLAEKKKIKIHLDELDFGCGDKQLLNDIYKRFKNDDNVNFILYSATIEVAKKEFIRPNNIDDSEYEEIDKFIPPDIYYGIGKYLQNNLFKQATPFFRYDNDELKITNQGSELIKKLTDTTKNTADKRHIGVLRLAGNFKSNDGSLKSQFETVKDYKNQIEEQCNIRIKFVGSKDEDVQWDNTNYWEDLESTKSFLIIINQVAGRSTEWRCHPYLCWYHTCRTDDTPTSTIIQDQERVVYYITAYQGYTISIELYGDKPAAEYSAGELTIDQYDSMTDRKLNSRLNTKIKNEVIIVKEPLICNSWAEIPEEYKKGRSLDSHINEDYKLKPTMKSYDKKEKKEVEYNIKNWGKYIHLEGFYMTNVRSSRDKFIKGKSATPIWFKTDLLKEKAEGINKTSRVRINVFYEDGEKDPSKYKFMIREYLRSEKADVKNTSMYVN